VNTELRAGSLLRVQPLLFSHISIGANPTIDDIQWFDPVIKPI
jgi:hypothetical protein